MSPRRSTSLASNPLLIGAVTTLIIVVAVFLAYNANNGLPFVPTYDINVELPEASGLIKANQVRIAGTRVGLVTSITPKEYPATGRVVAVAHLQLEKKLESLPANTHAIVQSVSAIGLRYLELEKGNSVRKIPSGGTLPSSQVRETVAIDELFNMFNRPTRAAIKVNSNNFGDGLAARGRGLNETIAELKPLVEKAIPVLHNLASKETNLKGLFKALDRAAEQGANVAQQQAQYYVDLNTFFTAWATVTKPLEEATAEGPASLRQAIYSLPHQAPLLEKAATFMHLLRPSAESLTTVAPELAHAFTVGTKNFKTAESLTKFTTATAKSLEKFTKNPIVILAFEDFTRTAELGAPLLAGIAPEQEKCNYLTLTFRNLASLESENIGVGTLARSAFLLSPLGPNNDGYPASAPANGHSQEKTPDGQIIPNNYLHANPYPNVSGAGQRQVCEAGNEAYLKEKTVDSNLPASDVENNREFTSRSQDLYGEKYPSSVQKALGLKGGS
ncbi:MAG TPA: MlaD family protein [Solirubrobacteraceae bacterium]|nr:MlaD family protein [Solirubrobacteraceae bacterium]